MRDKLDKYPRTEIGGKMRSFQEKWFQDRPWLEHFKGIDAALCFPCRLLGSDKYDSTFWVKGFKQWNRALKKNRGFDKRCCSAYHEQSMFLWTQYLTTEPIDSAFDSNKKNSISNRPKNDRNALIFYLC